jgi:hypothetical protein
MPLDELDDEMELDDDGLPDEDDEEGMAVFLLLLVTSYYLVKVRE